MMKKITSLVVALALVAGVFGAVSASAATPSIADLQAMIASLTQQLAALSGGTTTSTGATTFTSNLSVGSRGEQVTALQEALNTEVDANITTFGYFGPMTKAAVIKFQKANGISGTGTVGPLTRAALNALQAPVTVPTTGTTGTTGTPATSLDNTDGSVTATISSIAPTSQTMTKGDTKDIYAIKFTAVGGKVNVNRIDVNFTDRPWLVFNQVVLKDQSGAVIATKTLSGLSDVTEVTIGSSYNVRFDNLNVVVTPGTDTNIVVSASIPANNSYIGTSPYDATTVSIPTSGIRTINGKGYTDSTTVSGTDVLTLTTTGSKADLSVTNAPTSPLAGQVNIASANGADTTNVPLAVYRVRSTNLNSTLNTLVFTVQTNPGLGSNLSAQMKNFKLNDGSNTVYGSLSGNTVTFTLSNGIALTKDVVKDLTLTADIVGSSTSFSASTTMVTASIGAIDDNFVSPTYGGSPIGGATSVTSANLTFTNNSLSVKSTSAGMNVKDINNGTNPVTSRSATFSITLHNGSVNNLFVSGVTGDMLGTTTVPATNASTTVVSVVTADGQITGDTGTTEYVIPAGGDRTFNFTAQIGKKTTADASQSLTISSVKYGAVSGTYTSTVTAGLSPLTDLEFFSTKAF